MKKIKEWLLSRNFVLITFVLLGVRAMVVEPGMGFAITATAFAGLIGYKMYLDSKITADVNADLKADLEVIRTQMSGLMMKNAARPAEMAREIKRFF